MEKQVKINEMKRIVSEQSTEQLKEILEKLMSNFADGSQYAFDVVMSELMERLPENEFIEFCEILEEV